MRRVQGLEKGSKTAYAVQELFELVVDVGLNTEKNIGPKEGNYAKLKTLAVFEGII